MHGSLFRGENGGSGRLSNLHKVTELAGRGSEQGLVNARRAQGILNTPGEAVTGTQPWGSVSGNRI